MKADLVVTFKDDEPRRTWPLDTDPATIDALYRGWCLAEHWQGHPIEDVELQYGWNALDYAVLVVFLAVVLTLFAWVLSAIPGGAG